MIIPGIVAVGYLIFSGKIFDIRDSVYLAFFSTLQAVKCGVIASLVALCLGLAFYNLNLIVMGFLFTTLFVAIDQAIRKPRE